MCKRVKSVITGVLLNECVWMKKEEDRGGSKKGLYRALRLSMREAKATGGSTATRPANKASIGHGTTAVLRA